MVLTISSVKFLFFISQVTLFSPCLEVDDHMPDGFQVTWTWSHICHGSSVARAALPLPWPSRSQSWGLPQLLQRPGWVGEWTMWEWEAGELPIEVHVENLWWQVQRICFLKTLWLTKPPVTESQQTNNRLSSCPSSTWEAPSGFQLRTTVLPFTPSVSSNFHKTFVSSV